MEEDRNGLRYSPMEEDDFISKTRRKQEMHGLQTLGEELVSLKDDKLAELDLPESLLSAVREARRLSKHGALRRQLQYIGRLMRDVDAEPIREKLHGWRGQGREAVALQHLAERWRERLIADDAEFRHFVADFPAQTCRTCVRWRAPPAMNAPGNSRPASTGNSIATSCR